MDYRDYWKRVAKDATVEDAVELYGEICDKCERFESEWREEFISYFPASASRLPDPDEVDEWQGIVSRLIRANNLPGLKAFVLEHGSLNMKFDPKKTYEECAKAGQTDEFRFRPFDLYPLESQDEDGFTPVKLAQSLRFTEIQTYLEEQLKAFDIRYKAAYEEGKRLKGGK